jgi:hypothetical protein
MDHDALRFMNRKAETKTSAPELDAEVDKEILTVADVYRLEQDLEPQILNVADVYRLEQAWSHKS